MPLDWDVGAGAGVMHRVMTGSGPSAAAQGPGIAGELRAHVALVPLVRLGPYLAYGVAPPGGATERQIASAGPRARVSPPLVHRPWRPRAFAGLRYARALSPRARGRLLQIPIRGRLPEPAQ